MRDFLLKRIVVVLLPFIQLYGFYVIIHGHVFVGGTFAGGILVGLTLISFATVFGVERGRARVPEKVFTFAETYGTLWYGVIGMIGMLKGVSFLANKMAGIDLGMHGALSSGGLIPLISIGVGLRVASTMDTLFFTMVEDKS